MGQKPKCLGGLSYINITKLRAPLDPPLIIFMCECININDYI